MSQPSNDAEVENVLSAIRRLIEEGGVPSGAPLDRLVLTPALRVEEPSEPTPLAAAGTDHAAAPSAVASDPLVLLNALPTTPPPIVSDSPESIPEAGNEEIAPDEPLAGGPSPVEELGSTPPSSAPVAATTGRDLGDLPDPDVPDLADLSNDPGAEDAALADVHHPDEDLGPTGLSSGATADATAGGLPESDASLGADQPRLPGAQEASWPAPAASEPEDEPDAAVGFLSQMTSDPAPSTTQPEPPASWPDEATLRALVAEAVREELRGELGEKLTRNLRKLVRREVMQALALRDG